MWDCRNDHRNTNTGLALCSATVQKAFGFSRRSKDSHTWKKLGSVCRNLHISVKFSKNKISARSFQVRKIPLRIQVNDKRQMPGKTGRPPNTSHMPLTMLSDIQLGENTLGEALEERWRPGSHQQYKIFLDVLFLGPGPFVSNGMFCTAQSVPRRWQNKANSKSLRKNGSKDPPATLPVSFGLISNEM